MTPGSKPVADAIVELRRVSDDLAVERRVNRAAADRLRRITPIYQELRLAVERMQATKFWRMRQGWFALKQRLGLSNLGPAPLYAPPAIEELSVDDDYEYWRSTHALRAADAAWIRDAVAAMAYHPTFSIIVPTYNTPDRYLRPMLESVLAQLYPDWQLCIADDASTNASVAATLAEFAERDPRISVSVRTENGHISAASNSALAMATGEFTVLLDHDDLLCEDALFQAALVLNRRPDLDMIYSDEDKIDDDGRLKTPFFKPDWSPERFLSQMYTAHLGVYRTSLVRELGGFREGYEGSQDYDLVLRLTERTDRIHHIPRILYHWRTHAESTAAGMAMKPYAEDAALRALREALARRGERATVLPNPDAGGTYVVRYEILDPERLVSVIVPTRDHGDDLERCLITLFEKTTYPNFEVVLVDNGTTEARALDVLAAWHRREPRRLKILERNVPFNYSSLNNDAVAESASGEFLLFLNNDTEIIDGSWISGMIEQAQRPAVGAVGVKLLYPDDRIQHAGVILGIGGIAGHSHKYLDGDANGYFATPQIVHNVSAVTAACMMLRRNVFEEVNGFDERLAVAFNDVDLCMRIGALGYRNIYVAHVVLYHHESKSRGQETTPAQQARFRREIEFMEERWRFSALRDPYYNPNLTLAREDYSLSVV